MRKAAAAPAVLVLSLAATGWLYLVQPALPGPRIGEALPLDELSRHSSASLAWYAVVWAVTGLALGGVLRWARVERFTAGLLLAHFVGLWVYLTDGVSIAVVRQIAARVTRSTPRPACTPSISRPRWPGSAGRSRGWPGAAAGEARP